MDWASSWRCIALWYEIEHTVFLQCKLQTYWTLECSLYSLCSLLLWLQYSEWIAAKRIQQYIRICKRIQPVPKVHCMWFQWEKFGASGENNCDCTLLCPKALHKRGTRWPRVALVDSHFWKRRLQSISWSFTGRPGAARNQGELAARYILIFVIKICWYSKIEQNLSQTNNGQLKEEHKC